MGFELRWACQRRNTVSSNGVNLTFAGLPEMLEMYRRVASNVKEEKYIMYGLGRERGQLSDTAFVQ